NTGTARVDIWTDVRGVVLRSVGNEKVPLQNPLVFQPGEKICPADGTTGANSVVITGTLKSTSSGVVNMPMTSQVGLAMLTLVVVVNT
ncbi:MAG: hypothetical protein QF898_10905, partial [SAR202 cluster bacterium]|nr:hypothetical protein [SAR202 cluster bacterium]